MPFEYRRLRREKCQYPGKAPFRSGSLTNLCGREAVVLARWSDISGTWDNWKKELFLCSKHKLLVREREEENDTTAYWER